MQNDIYFLPTSLLPHLPDIPNLNISSYPAFPHPNNIFYPAIHFLPFPTTNNTSYPALPHTINLFYRALPSLPLLTSDNPSYPALPQTINPFYSALPHTINPFYPALPSLTYSTSTTLPPLLPLPATKGQPTSLPQIQVNNPPLLFFLIGNRKKRKWLVGKVQVGEKWIGSGSV